MLLEVSMQYNYVKYQDMTQRKDKLKIERQCIQDYQDNLTLTYVIAS